MEKNVIVRIAPSPTGFAHVGTAYVALLNLAFAKKNNGKLILRLDDTDTKRHVEGAEEAIYSGLSWLGLSWDEGPDKADNPDKYKPSKRLHIYQKYADELLEKGLAYKDEGAIRFKNTLDKPVSWDDVIRGTISFPAVEVTDYVIIKSDGYPTYNFGTVIDDYEMKITHVIRGDEHISNTPRQIATYMAFGWDIPKFAHFPTLRNAERKKLSKRRDPVDLRMYREAGYLPEAMLNFFGLLGWSHPEGKEIFDLQEFIEKFDLKRVRKAGPIFDTQKLDWLNGQYIRNIDNQKLSEMIYQKVGSNISMTLIEKIAPLIKERINKISDAESLLTFFWQEPQIAKEIFENTKAGIHVPSALTVLSKIDDWNLASINTALSEMITAKEFKVGEFYMSMRLAITGKGITPPINESMELLGKDQVIRRLESAQRELLEIDTGEFN